MLRTCPSMCISLALLQVGMYISLACCRYNKYPNSTQVLLDRVSLCRTEPLEVPPMLSFVAPAGLSHNCSRKENYNDLRNSCRVMDSSSQVFVSNLIG